VRGRAGIWERALPIAPKLTKNRTTNEEDEENERLSIRRFVPDSALVVLPPRIGR